MRTLFILVSLILTWNYSIGQNILREKVQKTYLSQVGVREKGNNTGYMVDQYLASVNFKPGYPWCAAFVSWVYTQNRVINPRNAWVPSWFTSHIIWKRNNGLKNQMPLPGDVFGLYYSEKNIIGHIGFVHRYGNKIVITVEGNTNNAGSSEGEGVYIKRRPTRQIYVVARYIKEL